MKNRAVKYGIIIGALVLVLAIVTLVIVFGFSTDSDDASKKLPEKITVPSVIGRNITDAEKLLCDIGFTVTKNEEYDQTVLKDRDVHFVRIPAYSSIGMSAGRSKIISVIYFFRFYTLFN